MSNSSAGGSPSSDPDCRLAEVLEAFVERLEAGEAPSEAEIAAAHPDFAKVLPEYLDGVRLIHEALGARPSGEADATGDHPPIDAGPSTAERIGDYELLREIGRGGMGVVYEAEQLSLARRVALKVLPFAAVLDDRQVKRFRTEAQAAAGLHHANIVPVFAVGQDRGVYYYAMQFVEGQSLAEAIDGLRREWSPPLGSSRDRVEQATTVSLRIASTVGLSDRADHYRAVATIGAQAAEALQHAHDYGVVHRDVKPSNLLLDAAGKLWVTDFGLARVSAEGSVTMPGDVVGTLRYMSPEQARGRNDMIDGRTDIYALGATLYELLTLMPAHPGDDHQALLRRIESQEPTPPRRVNPDTPADLETIVLRAMQKTREDRYATAGELADDLHRFLDGKPTIARRPGIAERAGRWLMRHRKTALGVAASLAVIAFVSVAAVASLVAANRRAATALEQSRASLARAETHYEEARLVVDHFAANVADQLAQVPGAERLRRRLLISSLAYYREFLRTAGDDPTLLEDLAATHFKAATLAERLGDTPAARDDYAKAVTYWRQIDRPGDLALGLDRLARTEGQLARPELAEALLTEALEVARQNAEQAGSDPAALRRLAETLSNRGVYLRRVGDRSAAAERLLEAAQLFEQARHLAPEDRGLARSAAVAHSNLGETLREIDPDEALAAADQALQTLRSLSVESPEDDSFRADFAMALNNSAAIHAGRGEWDEAAAGYGEAADEAERLARRQPFATARRHEVAIARGNHGFALAKTGDASGSEQAFEAAVQTLGELCDEFPDRLEYTVASAALWNNRGVALKSLGRVDAATAAFGRSIAVLEAIPDEDAAGKGSVKLLEAPYENYASVHDDARSVESTTP